MGRNTNIMGGGGNIMGNNMGGNNMGGNNMGRGNNNMGSNKQLRKAQSLQNFTTEKGSVLSFNFSPNRALLYL